MKFLKIPKLFTLGNELMNKRLLRQEIKNKRNLLSSDYKKASSEKIAEIVTASAVFTHSQSIFVYVSSSDEPNTDKIIKKALSSGKTVYVPKCIKKGVMIPVIINENTVFSSGYMGISEPAEYDEAINISQIDLSIIPCVSAALSGERLGHGAAFYDIFLSKVKTEKFCLCFHKLISEYIPSERTDIKMDAVITERGIYTTEQKKSP